MQFQVVFLIAVGSCFALASADLKIAEKDIQKSVTEGRNNYHKALYTYNEIGSAIGRALTQWTSPVEKFTFLDAKSSDPPPINISAACLSSLMTIVAHVDFRNVSHNPEWIIRCECSPCFLSPLLVRNFWKCLYQLVFFWNDHLVIFDHCIECSLDWLIKLVIDCSLDCLIDYFAKWINDLFFLLFFCQFLVSCTFSSWVLIYSLAFLRSSAGCTSKTAQLYSGR